MGTGTRKALEQFQRERSLTVTGELDARTLRELQAQSRVSIP
jgi:peptidoglycan hydrolase-like protein with peptidoglycan-binding domain